MMLNERERSILLDATRPLAKLAFGLLLVLSPFRMRIELLARPSPPLYGDYTDLLLFWSDLAALLTLALWAVALWARRSWRSISLGPPFLSIPIAGLLLLGWIGIPFAVDPTIAAYTAIRLTVLAAVALYVLNEFEGLAQLRVPLAAMLVVQALVVVAQVSAGHSVGLGGLGEHTLDPSMAVSVVTAADGSRLVRGYGLSDHPNILGGLLAFAALLIVVAPGRDDPSGRVWASVLFAVGAVAVLLTFSRSAGLALAIGFAALVAMLAARRDRGAVRQVGAAAAIAALACLPFLLAYEPYVLARTDPFGAIETEARSISEREALTIAANDVFLGHPVLGVGLGGLPHAIRDAQPAFEYPYQPAHVVLLDVAAETGALGALLYLAILVAPWLALARHRPRWTPDLAATSAALAALSVVGLFDYYTWSYPAGRIWAWVVLALWAAAYRRATAEAEATDRPSARPGLTAEPAGA